MKKYIVKTLLNIIFLSVAVCGFSQSMFYQETFDTNNGWTLDQNWSIETGVLTLSWSPSVEDYSLSALSPDLVLPVNAGDLVVTQFVDQYTGTGTPAESFEIAVMVGTTPTVLWTYNSDNDWGGTEGTDLTLSLSQFSGQTIKLRFRSAGESTFNIDYWHIYEVKAYASLAHDMTAQTLTGNPTPSVGTFSNYVLTVCNTGANTESNYSVKLIKEGNVEIASLPGVAITPGQTHNFTIPWTPTTAGATYIFGKVVMDTDMYITNNQTANYPVIVQPEGVIIYTIGDGSQAAQIPLDFYYQNSLYETIYYASELNFIGMITGISLYTNFLDDLHDKPTKIWMGTTNQTDLNTDWIPSTQLTPVFDGTANYHAGTNTVNIMFPQPFLYLEGNLVVMFNRPMDNSFYNQMDYFYCQSTGTNRARNAYGDGTAFNPANPSSEGTTVTLFPKTSFYAVPGGVGHLTGNVYGAGNIPLNNTTVQIVGGTQATTDAQGHYSIQNIIAGTYQVSASRFGYVSQTLTVIIPEDSTVTQNFTLTQMPTVSVTGTVVGSDAPTVGLSGAIVSLTGMENYTATTNAQGEFTINGVYANQNYTYHAGALGYQVASGAINVSDTNYAIGTIIVSEIAFTPRDVTAVQNETHTEIALNWQPPDPNAADVTQSFEGTAFPPAGWTRVVTDSNPAGPNGVFPTWCRFGTVVDVSATVAPVDGLWQCGLWWDYNHQDEWLITPQFNCPQGANLIFNTHVFRGSTNGDHYYVKVTINDGADWTVVWDASTLYGGWNDYQTPVQIDLSTFAGQQVKIAWHADDYEDNQGMWHNWFIDNVVVGNTITTIHFDESQLASKTAAKKATQPQIIYSDRPMSRATERNSLSEGGTLLSNLSSITGRHEQTRSLLGYKVWRLLQGQEQNETTWSLLTPDMITALAFVDAGWATLSPGTYKWAVKGVYTGEILSLGAFSNTVSIPYPTGNLEGFVRNAQNIPINGATISAGSYMTTSSPNGNYNLTLPAGTYTITCATPTYNTQTQQNVEIVAGQSTILNFTLTLTENEDEIAVPATVLRGNYPNPFNPETTITYDVKVTAPVKIEIFNTKGQLIRSLVSEVKGKGHYQIGWNGKDNNGSTVASGVYHYRMQAGDYKSTRMMMLMK